MKDTLKFVFGNGINDADYKVRVNGKLCPYYKKWLNMLCRCYDDTYAERNTSYTDCIVCPEWLTFSNFSGWVDGQPNKDWQSSCLDKDLFLKSSKIYSPETCVFVDNKVNSFIVTRKGMRGEYLIGVDYHTLGNKFNSRCNDPFKVNKPYLGLFKTELEAHKAWQAKKHEYACQLAELQEDPRVAEALRQRYAPDKDWTKE